MNVWEYSVGKPTEYSHLENMKLLLWIFPSCRPTTQVLVSSGSSSATSWILPTTNRALWRMISTGSDTGVEFICDRIVFYQDPNELMLDIQRKDWIVNFYRKTIINLGSKLEDYWKEIRYRKTIENPNSTVPVEDTTLVEYSFCTT